MEDLTRIDDNSVVFKREGIYQARIRVDGKYVYRSLKICDNYATISCIFKGDTGEQGPQGEQGPPGQNGIDGQPVP